MRISRVLEDTTIFFSVRFALRVRCACPLAIRQRWTPSAQHRRFSGKYLLDDNKRGGAKLRLRTLAIETSCDDTSVAVLFISRGKDGYKLRAEVLFHEKVTASTDGYGGIHPIVALDSHQTELARLVQRAVRTLEPGPPQDDPRGANSRVLGDEDGSIGTDHGRRPDFISVTRGPGMRSNLSVGLNTAKGLALAWNIPLIGVHHMQAHALTPRLCAAVGLECGMGQPLPKNGKQLEIPDWTPEDIQPNFPFLSVLVSGGHTLLIKSASLTDHRILAGTQDIAIGDYLDKAARAILLPSELKSPFGRALEDFAFPSDKPYDYSAPRSRQEELERRTTSFGWSLGPPLAESKGGEKSSRRMVYTFSGLLSSVERLMRQNGSTRGSSNHDTEETAILSIAQRRELAREAQRVAFEHLGSRILLHLEPKSKAVKAEPVTETIVVSGGVASNRFLRHVLRSMLDIRGYANIKLLFPLPELCTDNALMIAWAGMEMYDAGYESDLSIRPLRKWSMDSSAEDGGILGVGGWRWREQEPA